MVHASEAQMAYDWQCHIADFEPDYDEPEDDF